MIKFDPFSLLQRGYFPKELPYNFNTYSFALHTKSMLAKLVEGFFRGVNKASLPTIYSIPRGESSRRDLAILNPWNYLKIVKCLVDYEDEINRNFPHSEYSLSIPTNSETLSNRSITPYSPNLLFYKQEMVKRSIGKKVMLKLDVNNFYPSVYTHTIEWALVGKDKAKKVWSSKLKSGVDRDVYNIGKKIDEVLRYSQSEETHGIPVGPDVSFLIGELILCRIDEEIHAQYPNIKGCRYYDDYTFFVSNEHEAESLLKSVHTIMRRYGIDINERKVEIKAVPCQLFNSSIDGLLQYRGLASISSSVLLGYFDAVWSMAEKNPKRKSSIFKYALKTLLSKCFETVWNSENKELLHSLLLKTVSIEPTIVPIVHQLFQQKKHAFSDNTMLEECIVGILAENISLHHHIEISWALWLAYVYGIDLDKSIILQILDLNNAVCSLQVIAYVNDDKHKNCLVDFDVQKKLKDIEKSFDEETLYGAQWLLLYESTLKGWLDGKKFIEKHSFFKYLYECKVSFFDMNNEADYSSVSYLKGYLFTTANSKEMEDDSLKQANRLWSKVKADFYADSGLSEQLDIEGYESAFSDEMPDDKVITELFVRLLLINAHMSDETLESVESELLARLSSCFDYR